MLAHSSPSPSPRTPRSRRRLRTRTGSITASYINCSTSASPPPEEFNSLLVSVLGSPFITTADGQLPAVSDDLDLVDGAPAAVPHEFAVTRPPSPVPTVDYSMISPPSPTLSAIDVFANLSGASWASSSSPYQGRPVSSLSAFHHWLEQSGAGSPSGYYGGHGPNTSPLRRFWDALAVSPSAKKGKGRELSPSLYDESLPLDGDEGELVDDEGCFIDVVAIHGIDILYLLPPEISLYILTFLDLPAIMACLGVSRRWRQLAQDNSVWHRLFLQQDGWKIDIMGARALDWKAPYERYAQPQQQSVSRPRSRTAPPLSRMSSSNSRHRPSRERGVLSVDRRQASSSSSWAPPLSTSTSASTCYYSPLSSSSATLSVYPTSSPSTDSGLAFDWTRLFRARMALEQRWTRDDSGFKPRVSRINGHADSVYCLELDTTRIFTGSRDRTIKVWSLRTGALLGTFSGEHNGSVLCLKFEKDWDLDRGGEGESRSGRRGFMVSGSSDHTMRVWDVWTERGWQQRGRGERDGEGEGEVRAEVKAVLTGHEGGVLDLRTDERWIVSCSKDTLIRVWDRRTLTVHCTLRGHDGPVNAVGLENGRIVSASGDGTMMLWDIASGTHIRTFEGHERGLACIEFKNDFIVSGSNDCKIKIWRASTGDCLRTLTGHESLVRALAFDPELGRLVSASYDRSVRVWDFHTGKLLREFRDEHASQIFDVRFNATKIVSTSHDQRIVILDFSQGTDDMLFA